MAKIEITIEDIGSTGNVKVYTKPKIHQIQKMVKNKEAPPCMAYAGIMLKEFFKVVPKVNQAIMPGDDQAFVPQKSKLYLPGRDF